MFLQEDSKSLRSLATEQRTDSLATASIRVTYGRILHDQSILCRQCSPYSSKIEIETALYRHYYGVD